MNSEVQAAAEARGITRLCHFTPSRNLQHIAAGGVGILSTKNLSAEERAAFNPTDLYRYDARTTHICCSVEFPNGWYFDRVREKEALFPNWVVLLIKPDCIWRDGTLFSPRNAAAESGRLLQAGVAAFEAMYAPRVSGAYNRTYTRTTAQRPSCPTDQQAEVLVEDKISLEDILAVAVRSAEQAATERVSLRTNGLDPDLFNFVIAPHLFSKYQISHAISYGLQPSEPPHQVPNLEGDVT